MCKFFFAALPQDSCQQPEVSYETTLDGPAQRPGRAIIFIAIVAVRDMSLTARGKGD